MYKIAVTGSPGSGKSKALKFFESLGAVTIDLDSIARDLLNPGTVEFEATVEAFGGGIVREDGQMDRRKLRNKIIYNEDDRHILEAIMWPSIEAEFENHLKEIPFDGTVVVEVAILTIGFRRFFDKVVLVVAPKDVKIERIMKRDNCTAHEADALISMHPDDSERRISADVVIDNP